jgi:hypothetical protein
MRTFLRELTLVAAVTAAGGLALMQGTQAFDGASPFAAIPVDGTPDEFSPPSAPALPVALEPAIFATVLDSLGIPSTFGTLAVRELLFDSAGWVISDVDSEWLIAALAGVRRETIDAFRHIADSAGDAQSLFSDHRGVAWVPGNFANRVAPRDAEGIMYLRISRVAFASDSSQALLYVSLWCGSLCARGEFFLLERATDSRWRVRSRVVTVVA